MEQNEEAEGLHPLTKLLLARMETDPEEFTDDLPSAQNQLLGTWPVNYKRWQPAIDALQAHGSEEDKRAFGEALRKLQMGAAHEWAMDELYNGEARREQKKKDDLAYQMKTAQAQAQSKSMGVALNLTNGSGCWEQINHPLAGMANIGRKAWWPKFMK